MPAFYEWAGLAFGPKISDAIPIPSGELSVTERHIPYSDASVIDIGGRLPRHYATTIRINPNDYVAFDAALGQTADLYLANQLYPAATLVKLSAPQSTIHGEWILCEAEWVL